MRMRNKFLVMFALVELLLFAFSEYIICNIRIFPITNIFIIFGILSLLCVNKLVKNTQWYRSLFVDYEHEIYPDNVWYRKHSERNYDVVVLGSTSAKYAYDFSRVDIKAMNWAQQPQTLIDDFKLLKSFHSILKDNGTIIINIMPFTSINKVTGFYDTLKYVGTLDSSLLDENYKRKALLVKDYPILLYKQSIIAILKKILKRNTTLDTHKFQKNPMSEAELVEDALTWVNNWKHQFNISSLDDELTEINKKGRIIRIELMKEIIEFCEARNYNVIFVILPVSSYLKNLLSTTFEQNYIYNFTNQFENIRVIDFLKDEDFQDIDLFVNSFYLNSKGAEILTKKIVDALVE